MSFKVTTRTAGLLLLATALAGCGSIGRDPIQVGSVPDDYRTRHPIVLSEQEQVLDVPVASGARELSVATLSNVEGFAAGFASAGTGVIYVMLPRGSANERAAAHVKGEILSAIATGGAARRSVIIQHYDATAHGPSAPVRLSYQGVEASTGPCGRWPDDLADTVENRNYHDFGCSSQSNLAKLVANPVDLLGPRKMSPIDATQRAAVIEDYQAGPVGGPVEVQY